jgi:hypothetical protein
MIVGNPLSATADFSVSISRDEKIKDKGMACRVGPAVWRLVDIIRV